MRRGSILPLVALLAVAGVCFAPLPATHGRPAGSGLANRLLGPLGGVAASVQWVRADLAFRNGRVELFLARAETALALAPESAEGWSFLAWTQAFALASPEHEADPARRLAWVRAGLATAAEGERVAEHPGELAFLAGLILSKTPDLDPDLPWPGGLAAALDQAAANFERAGTLGYDAGLAAACAASALRAADDWRRGQ